MSDVNYFFRRKDLIVVDHRENVSANASNAELPKR